MTGGNKADALQRSGHVGKLLQENILKLTKPLDSWFWGASLSVIKPSGENEKHNRYDPERQSVFLLRHKILTATSVSFLSPG
jgi:hypothetical protein